MWNFELVRSCHVPSGVEKQLATAILQWPLSGATLLAFHITLKTNRLDTTLGYSGIPRPGCDAQRSEKPAIFVKLAPHLGKSNPMNPVAKLLHLAPQGGSDPFHRSFKVGKISATRNGGRELQRSVLWMFKILSGFK